MSARPRRASDQQRAASDPQVSAWVAANAGSGKTTVLVDRVIRLLLEGTAPERILCLTYTKAAAALMANRLFGELARWVTLKDRELVERLEAAGLRGAGAEQLALARKLFTRALETPGGLKIQTIHAFCERLLQLFPVEAGIVPGFTVMDDATARALLMEARNEALADAARAPESPAGCALAKVAARAQADQLDQLITALLDERSDIVGILSGSQAIAAAVGALKRENGLGADEGHDAITREMLAIDRALYGRLVAWLDDGSTTEQKTAKRLKAVLESSAPQPAPLLEAFFTKELGARKISGLIAKKKIEDEEASLLLEEQTRLDQLLDKRCALEMIEATEALLLLGSAIIARFGALKHRRGLYDFDDLISGTRDLLTRSGAAQWVLYKLDGGIHHLLIDEAQDTSPAQWEIARALTEDFFAGAGAIEGVLRTIFAVGDRKQSIFSFQGADPDEFDAARWYFNEKALGAELEFRGVDLTVSHRSGAAVLEAVEAVFRQETAAGGLLRPEEKDFPVHEPNRKGQAGHAEIWPLEEADETEEPQPFEAPVDRPPANHPRRKLARRIAGTIAQWLTEKRELAARGRAIRPGDVLILVRRRSTLADALVSELRARNVPVAGADRLKLAEHIAVQDLLALARFVANPEDDYSLACLLKSPLVCRADGKPFDDDDLFALAHGRGSVSLWERLKQAEEREAIVAQFRQYMEWSGELTPFAFFARVLALRAKRVFARLGADAAEPLEAFLDLALEFERGNTPTLTGFVDWFMEAGAEIKRDMEQESGEVRIMTVHGAKGLEANVVFLADAADVPQNRGPQLLFAETDEFPEPLPLWKLGGMCTPRKIEEWAAQRKAREMEEYRRLLYVAMTRACDELYVCGCRGGKDVNPESWYALVSGAFRANGYGGEDGVLRLARSQEKAAAPDAGRIAPPTEEIALPSWLASAALPERVRPIAAGDEEDEPVDAAATARGRVVHRLIEVLPRLAPEARLAAARRYLARAGEDQSLAEAVTAILDAPEFAGLIGPDGLAEVSYLGRDGGGRIDRLLMSQNEALIIDYKSDRAPPASPSNVSSAYLKQLARYRETVGRIAGPRRIRAAILWTETARLMEIPEAMLESAV